MTAAQEAQMKQKILDLVKNHGDLPVLPDILIKLQTLLKNSDVEIVDIVRLIELEPTLAGNILKIANSAYYKTGYQQITTLLMAVNKLGLDKIKQIVFSLEIMKLFSKTGLIDATRFWKHGLAVANLAQMLAVYSNAPLKNLGAVYLAGLMHDVGIMVFCYLVPEPYAAFLKQLQSREVLLEKQEKQAFGINHQELGAYFIEKWWQMDDMIVQAVLDHHSPDRENRETGSCALMVHLANRICTGYGHHNGISSYHALFSPDELKVLGLSARDIEKMTNDVKTVIAQSVNLLEG